MKDRVNEAIERKKKRKNVTVSKLRVNKHSFHLNIIFERQKKNWGSQKGNLHAKMWNKF